MERYLLIVSTICFLAAVVHTVIELRANLFRPLRFNFIAIGLGFVFQTAFLWIRGRELGRCPITNLFEVFAYVLARDWNHFLEIQEGLLMQIREVIASNGAEIAYPVRTIHVKTEKKPEDLPAPQPQDVTSGGDGFLA